MVAAWTKFAGREVSGRGSSDEMSPGISPRAFAYDYSAERRGRGSSCTSGLQFRACHSITAEAVAKAPLRYGIASNQRTGKHERCLTSERNHCHETLSFRARHNPRAASWAGA